jgi:hypothetical protein
MKLSFDIASDLYLAGKTEGGQDFTAELYYVVAEDARGNRWRHPVNFPGADASRDDDGYWHFADVRETAQAAAERLRYSFMPPLAAPVDLDSWLGMPPAYGSAAYVEYGQFDEWCDERSEG